MDTIVSAQLPDKEKNPELYKIIVDHHLHNPCGSLNPHAPCMENGVCKFGFPFEYQEHTIDTEDGYPLYQRLKPDGDKFIERDKSVSLKAKDGGNGKRFKYDFTNKDVSSYNPYLAMKFNAHINVQIVSSVKAVKYLYKYVYKGNSKINFSVSANDGDEGDDGESKKEKKQESIDEISNYIGGRFVCAHEAISRIFGYKVHGQYPIVERLPVHLKDENVMYYKEGNEAQVANNERLKRTKLIAYFEAVSRELVIPLSNDELGYFVNKDGEPIVKPRATELTYQDFPEFYVYDETNRVYSRRKERSNTIGRIYFIQPNQGDIFYLRMLLTTVRGASSFNELKTFEHIRYDTFKESCAARGLLRDDGEWVTAMKEVCTCKMPYQIRDTFAIILAFNEVSDSPTLWDMFKNDMIEDYIFKYEKKSNLKVKEEEKNIFYNIALGDINTIILKNTSFKKKTTTFGLPKFDRSMQTLEQLIKQVVTGGHPAIPWPRSTPS